MNLSRIILKSTDFLLILFVLFTVLPVKLNFSSITIILLAILSIIHFLIPKNRNFNTANYHIFIISVPLAIYALGLLNTSNTDYGLTFITKNLSFLAFPLIFFSIGRHVNRIKLFKSFLFGLALTNLFLIYLFFYYFNFGAKFYMIVSVEIYHSTYLGMYNLLAFWICIDFYIRKSKKIYLFIALFFLVSALLTSARMIFILSILSLGTALLYIIKSNGNKILALLLLSSIGITLLLSIPSFKQKFHQLIDLEQLSFDKDNYQSISSRFGKIEATLEIINNNFWLGSGTGDLKDELVKEYERMEFVMGYKHRYNPHNQFLENLARNGVIGGGICLISIYFWPLYMSIRRRQILLTAFILVVSGVSLTESILDLHKGITFYVFFVTLMMSPIVQNKTVPKP